MFIVFNKEKINSYIILLSTVVILFSLAFTMTAKQTTQEKQIALTMNCAWNADDIDSILDTLSKYKIHITFFMVGDWVEKYPEAVIKISKAGHEIRKSFKYTSTCK